MPLLQGETAHSQLAAKMIGCAHAVFWWCLSWGGCLGCGLLVVAASLADTSGGSPPGSTVGEVPLICTLCIYELPFREEWVNKLATADRRRRLLNGKCLKTCWWRCLAWKSQLPFSCAWEGESLHTKVLVKVSARMNFVLLGNCISVSDWAFLAEYQ